ncbi:MAG: hypothetical protein IKX30_00195 [Victivallales bacterium]|nr:hypothetical protein [Victivallales bacterium]
MFYRPTFEKAFYRTMLQGWRRMSSKAQDLVRQGVVATQGTGGLFCGRGGQEDLYYTFFGLLLSLMPDMKINRKTCRHALDSIDLHSLDLIHFCAFFRSQRILHPFTWKLKYDISHLHSLPSTAYPHANPEAPYSRFLRDMLLNDCGEKTSLPDLHEYRLPNDLYSNLKNQTIYNVNATAAAAFLLPDELRRQTLNALSAEQAEDGTFGGNLLSTAVALFALQSHQTNARFSAKGYLQECLRENGFFAPMPDAPEGDLEYTVYGVLAMGATP